MAGELWGLIEDRIECRVVVHFHLPVAPQNLLAHKQVPEQLTKRLRQVGMLLMAPRDIPGNLLGLRGIQIRSLKLFFKMIDP